MLVHNSPFYSDVCLDFERFLQFNTMEYKHVTVDYVILFEHVSQLFKVILFSMSIIVMATRVLKLQCE